MERPAGQGPAVASVRRTPGDHRPVARVCAPRDARARRALQVVKEHLAALNEVGVSEAFGERNDLDLT